MSSAGGRSESALSDAGARRAPAVLASSLPGLPARCVCVGMRARTRVRVCLRAYLRVCACVYDWVCAWVRVWVRACVRVRVLACVHDGVLGQLPSQSGSRPR